jgi:hypothetical protein
MGWLNLWRLESDFLVNCLIGLLDFGGCRFLALNR